MTNQKLILVQFRPGFGFPSGSPFCFKLEMFLRMAKIPYEIEHIDMPNKAPLGKLPFIRFNGEDIGDSSSIIDRLSQEFTSANKLCKLKQADIHRAHLIKRMVEEHLYFCVLFERWAIDENWPITKKNLFAHLPPVIGSIVPPIARKTVLKQVKAQGIARHSKEEIFKRGIQDIQAVFASAAKSGYILGGKQPSFLDATVFSFISLIYHSPFDSVFKDEVRSNKRCVSYLQLMQKNWAKDIAPF